MAAARGFSAAASAAAFSCSCASGDHAREAVDSGAVARFSAAGSPRLAAIRTYSRRAARFSRARQQPLEQALGLGLVLGSALPLGLQRQRVGRLEIVRDPAPAPAASGAIASARLPRRLSASAWSR